jgi:hypothetical protein
MEEQTYQKKIYHKIQLVTDLIKSSASHCHISVVFKVVKVAEKLKFDVYFFASFSHFIEASNSFWYTLG